jgi:chromosome segregation protein
MYLKRLELQGYKTFATRTEFEFEQGITAIVGPNGSGKSNIADAVRWVMGEHRYSALRAKRSDDMIFSGGEGRARVGMAEVTLTLDNSTGWLPIDYSELTVQRRTYQSGENQYFINGSRVRRRDILELLAQGGVSSNTYTIIAQGAVDASLGMRPEERRLIFEEAAGISIHQAKREQALNRLEDTRLNLLRVNDIIGEIAPRLQRLRKQAERAQEYQEASKRLEELLHTWYAYRWRKAHGELDSARHAELSRQEELKDLRAIIEGISSSIDGLRQRRAELRGHLGGWHTESGALHTRLETLQRELAVKQETERLLRQRQHEIEQELAPLVASRDSRLRRIGELESELERLSLERSERESERDSARKELVELEGRQEQLEKSLLSEQELCFEVSTELASAQNLLLQVGGRRRDTDRERKEHEEVTERLDGQVARLTEEVMAMQAEQRSSAAELERLTRLGQDRRAATQTSSQQQKRLTATLSDLERSWSALQARWEVLSQAQSDLAGYGEAVRTVLSHREELPGVRTTLADLIRVPPHLEVAVDAALGHFLEAIITDRWEDAQHAIQFLEDADAGRAIFLPLDSLQPGRLEDTPDMSGVVGLAVDLVGIVDGLEGALRSLLGRTVVVQDLGVAREVHQRHPGLQVVTFDGEVIATNGSVTGGSPGAGSLLLAHERQRRELPEQMAQAEAKVQGARLALQEELARHEQLETELSALTEQRDRLEANLRSKEDKIASLRAAQEGIAQELDWRKTAATRLAEESKTLQEKERDLLVEAEAWKQKERESTASATQVREELASLNASPLQEKLAALRTAVAVLDRTRESQEVALSGHRANLEQIELQLAEKQRRVEELGSEAGQVQTAVASLQQQVDTLSMEVDNLSSEIAGAERESLELENQQDELESKEAATRSQLQKKEVEYNSAVLRRQRSEDELRNLQERIEAELESVSLPTDFARQLPLDIDARLRSLPVATQVPRELEEEIKHLRRRLRQLGPADLEALDEYDEVSERHSFLVGQVQDLEEAATSLRQVVVELDRTMSGVFVETFERVAVEFESYFTRLFNGGSAKLLLTEPDSPLTSGVEIVAQPPGRRRRSVAMLSGGERALTGVALTFAILNACETPFCFLDEVDSRLDEVNVGRFCESLAQLAENTQVVVITHNRLTLEKANSIYGITMGGDGASRVLSLRLEEAEARAAQA